jgi:NADH dehydrogenase
VIGIDPDRQRVTVRLTDQSSEPVQNLGYDRLILAAGSALARPEVPGTDIAFDIDTFDGAQRLADHIALLGRDTLGGDRAGRWTAVVVGAGLVGIEVACELPARLAVARDKAGDATAPMDTILIDHAREVGRTMGGAAMPAIRQALASAGVRCLGGMGVRAVDAAGLTLDDGTRLAAATVVWTTGMRASPLAQQLGAVCDPLGRLPVDAQMRVEGRPAIFAAGDVATAQADADGHRTVMSCQHARPMGRFAGHNAICDLAGRPDLALSFSAPDYVTVLDLGEWGAVYTGGWDRSRLIASGAAAKATKRIINGSRIYPPLDRDRITILASAAPVIQAAPTQSA